MNEHKHFRESVLLTAAFVALLWLTKSWEQAASADLSALGIYPRTLAGSIGILTSPLIHGDVQHLISNSFPLLILGTGLLFFYRPVALEVFTVIYFSTGLWVWAIARPAFHIGASGLVYGLAAFLFFIGLLRKDARSLAVSLVVVFLYHGLFAGIFPLSGGVSWESHLLGGCSGIMCAFYYRRRIQLPHDAPALTEEQEHTVKEEIEKEWQVDYMANKNAQAGEPEKCTAVKIPENLFIRFRNTSEQPNHKSDDKKAIPDSGDDDLISLN